MTLLFVFVVLITLSSIERVVCWCSMDEMIAVGCIIALVIN